MTGRAYFWCYGCVKVQLWNVCVLDAWNIGAPECELATSIYLAAKRTSTSLYFRDAMPLMSAQRAHSKLQKPPFVRASLRRGGRRD